MAERVRKVVSGEVDVATNVDPDARVQAEAAGGSLQVRAGTGVVVFVFVLTRESPLKERKVRQALNYAVNRQAIINDFLAGATRPAGGGLRANVPGYDPAIAPYPYDPPRARALLAQAGYAAGVTLRAEVSAGGGTNQAALLQRVFADLDSVGIRVQMRERPVPELMAYMFRGGWESDMFLMEYNASTGLDPMQPLQLHSCGWVAPWYCNEAATPLIKTAAVEHDAARRNQLFSEIYRAYHEDASALYLYEAVGFDAIGPDVVDFRAPNGIIDYAAVSKRPRKAAEQPP
jgi:peptide/nickel transport system substrate-binding protein